jgi:hypothetical protein
VPAVSNVTKQSAIRRADGFQAMKQINKHMLTAGASAADVVEIPAARQTNCFDCGLYVLAFTHKLCSLFREQSLGRAQSKRLDGASLPEPDVARGITRELLETECANVQVDGMRDDILQLITERSRGSH